MPHLYLDFIWYRAIAQLRSESSRSYLGVIWWILEPLIYLLVFYIVFALVLNRGDENFVQVLLCGLVVWKWFDGSIRSSVDVISQNAGLIDKVYLPKIVLPTVCVISQGIKFILVLILLLGFMLLSGKGMHQAWLWLPFLLSTQFILVFSFSCMVAALTPFIPDIRLLFDKFMTFLFFLSGIFYTLDSIPENLRGIFTLNPMFSMIESYRAVLIDHQNPEIIPLLYIFGLSLIVGAAAVFILRKFDRVYPRLIY